MKNLIAGGLVLGSLFFAGTALAQQVGTMPTLYDQNGTPVNMTSGVYVPAGWYYLAPGAQASNEVQYFGDGTFYNTTTGLYGGSVSDPNGTSGSALTYSTRVGATATPGIPNTGAGGDPIDAWTVLIASGAIVAAGALYIIQRGTSVRG